jgi:hypothetical protein
MGSTPTGVPSATPQQSLSPSQLADLQKQVLARRIRNGANWFFWITGLSLVNSFIALGGGGMRFIVGLGITQITDAVAKEAKLGMGVPLVIDLLAAGVFILFGLQAQKRRNWAFLTGMILYALDGLLLIMFKDFLGIGFHLYALYCIYKGMKANEQLEALERGILP